MITRGGEFTGPGNKVLEKTSANAAAREERPGEVVPSRSITIARRRADKEQQGEQVGRPLEVQTISCENLLETPLCYWSRQSVTFNQLDF